MATEVLMPRQGQSVETCLILEWKVSVGSDVNEGDILCEVETDKASFEVESPASGQILAILFPEGEDVEVLNVIAYIGAAGEAVPEGAEEVAPAAVVDESPAETKAAPTPVQSTGESSGAVSPRAKMLAESKGIDVSRLAGSGPDGRVIEQDVEAAINSGTARTVAAQATGTASNVEGSGIGGRATLSDLANAPVAKTASPATTLTSDESVKVTPLKGIRKLIAERMLNSLQTTAQLTLNSSADARAMLNFRKRLKASPDEMGTNKISINDLMLFAVSRTLLDYPELNSIFEDNTVYQHSNVHLAFAVDTARGLMVPVIRNSDTLSLKEISSETKTLAIACSEGGINPDLLSGGTFTVSNLGAFGIEHFTPVLNPPQVAILGIGAADLKAVQGKDGVEFNPHFALSLTINHQVVDGAPAAKFLKSLSQMIGNFDLYLAI
ncbi:MAG: 2-oxo acid dehydrogenase subunit E2 [Lentisphaeria bacterium]|nr:2-oxo acid dehydrogenase subunit E2 [Lentisphaeria bacterium]NQZ68282.1 2-oxo acid dehydrogenase subunit E2 [Lentisphaeria bacterium]